MDSIYQRIITGISNLDSSDLKAELDGTLERFALWDRKRQTYTVARSKLLPEPALITRDDILCVVRRSSELLHTNETLRMALDTFDASSVELRVWATQYGQRAAIDAGVYMYVLETLTLALDCPEFFASVWNKWSKITFDGPAMDIFTKVKAHSVLDGVRATATLEADQSLNEPRKSTLTVPFNISEAIFTDLVEGNVDNVAAGRRLVTSGPVTSDQKTQVLRMNTTAAWNTIYVLWNLSFVCRFGSSSQFVPLLLPCLLETCLPSASTNTQRTFINYRSQSLLGHLIYTNSAVSKSQWWPTEQLRLHLGRHAKVAAERLLPNKPSRMSTFSSRVLGLVVRRLFRFVMVLERWGGYDSQAD